MDCRWRLYRRLSDYESGLAPSPDGDILLSVTIFMLSLATHARILGIVLICSILWGSAFPTIKYVYGIWEMESIATRFLFAGVRFTIAGLLVLLFISRDRPLDRLRRADWRLLAVFTLFQTVGQYLFFYLALSTSSGILGSLLVSAGSFWWVLLAPLLLKSPPPTAKHYAILVMCAIGISIAVYAPGAGAGRPLLGGALFLCSSLSGTLGVIVLQPLSKTIDVTTATGFSLFAGGLVLTLLGLPAIGEATAFTDLRIAGTTIYLAIVSAAAFTLWNGLTRQYPVNLLAGYRFLIPLCGVLQSTWFISTESPGAGIYIGGSIVIFGIVLLSRLSSIPARPIR
ncbi:MAG: DMT family transporter [Verrucomicrobiales bacterium]|nr:DMT family transporter [Verrucomicrobiales bacterium]